MITFFHAEPGLHTDKRRRILDAVLSDDLDLPFAVRQIKIVEVLEAGMVVGNHYHTEESGRYECFVVLSPFTIRFRESPGEEVQERLMAPGDGCLIPPTVSHAFRAEAPGHILGLANLKYDSKHDIPDILF